MKAVLLAAVLSWMHTLAGPTLPKAAPAIADVIVLAVAEDTEPPVLQTRAQDAALMTKTVWNESHFELNPKPWKIEWTGLWCGPFQETCATMPPTLLGQARRALWLLHRGAESCPESPAAPYLGGCRGGEARREGDRRLTGALELVGGLAASPDEFALIL